MRERDLRRRLFARVQPLAAPYLGLFERRGRARRERFVVCSWAVLGVLGAMIVHSQAGGLRAVTAGGLSALASMDGEDRESRPSKRSAGAISILIGQLVAAPCCGALV